MCDIFISEWKMVAAEMSFFNCEALIGCVYLLGVGNLPRIVGMLRE
jgi:hypothetical protein